MGLSGLMIISQRIKAVVKRMNNDISKCSALQHEGTN